MVVYLSGHRHLSRHAGKPGSPEMGAEPFLTGLGNTFSNPDGPVSKSACLLAFRPASSAASPWLLMFAGPLAR